MVHGSWFTEGRLPPTRHVRGKWVARYPWTHQQVVTVSADLSSNFVCSVLLYPTLSIGSGQESPSGELFFSDFRHRANGRGLFPGADNDTTEVVVKRDDNGRLRVSCCILAA